MQDFDPFVFRGTHLKISYSEKAQGSDSCKGHIYLEESRDRG